MAGKFENDSPILFRLIPAHNLFISYLLLQFYNTGSFERSFS